MGAYDVLFRSVLSRMDPERAHHLAAGVIRAIPRLGLTRLVRVATRPPASLAVETGRIWMPKADLEMLIYDQNREKGFVPTLSIGAPVAK